MRRLYEEFLGYGYMPGQFYLLSVNEAIDVISGHRRRKEENQKEDLQKLISVLDLFGSNLIEKVFSLFGKIEKEHFSMLEYFPELFSGVQTKENEVPEEQPAEKKLPKEMQLYKAQRIQHAYHINRKNAQKKELANAK